MRAAVAAAANSVMSEQTPAQRSALPTRILARNETTQKMANVPVQIRKNCKFVTVAVGGILTSATMMAAANATFRPAKVARVMPFKCWLIIMLEAPNARDEARRAKNAGCANGVPSRRRLLHDSWARWSRRSQEILTGLPLPLDGFFRNCF